eukprot:CAMPEP_0174906558 /NCGR_PEP_ID=MMETSP0167-20121228/57608_1 /TAXON_ID=38298 /ORGANISM="Rhodella maculata, Strain CCMP736" /LENGTH=82 /DNA_ID=CAMNT_0016149823 /DNA_START=477 /DNA_END=722 /DNA_ORIENTATION=-
MTLPSMGLAPLLLALTLPLLGVSFPSYVPKVPNGPRLAPLGCGHFGHDNCAAGGPTNSFGRAFAAAGRRWTVGLCQADSDGD